jgi:phage baseplate assembly protein W
MGTLSYPLTVENGGLKLTSDQVKLIPEVMKHILQTRYEERVMRPLTFGINSPEFVNVSYLPDLLTDLEASLAEGLQEYPGVTFRLLGSVSDDGNIPITVYWYVDDITDVFEFVVFQ